MTFEPVLPPAVLGVAAAALLIMRLAGLRTAGSGGWALLRWTGTTVALLLVVLAAARPVTGGAAERESIGQSLAGANVFFLVDRSADSAIADLDGAPRMAAMRSDIEALIAEHPGSRFAVISFAARPAIDWPLSADAWSLAPVVEALNPYPGSEPADVNAAAPATVLRYQLISASQQFPRAPNLVYYLGSGAPQSVLPQGVFDPSNIDGGAVLGYGRAVGGSDGGPALRTIGNQLGLPYVDRAAGAAPPGDPASSDASAAAADPSSAPQPVQLYWVLTMIASALLLIEIFLTARDLRRAGAIRREVVT